MYCRTFKSCKRINYEHWVSFYKKKGIKSVFLPVLYIPATSVLLLLFTEKHKSSLYPTVDIRTSSAWDSNLPSDLTYKISKKCILTLYRFLK